MGKKATPKGTVEEKRLLCQMLFKIPETCKQAIIHLIIHLPNQY